MNYSSDKDVLAYVRRAREYEAKAPEDADIRLAIVTNFTDDLLGKLIVGMCAAAGTNPSVYQVPFKQYLFELKDPKSALARHNADITFIFFDANPYVHSEFVADGKHASATLHDIERYAQSTRGIVVAHTLPAPAALQHGRLLRDSAHAAVAHAYNSRLAALEKAAKNIHVVDTDRMLGHMGEREARDLRGLYAFSQPFAHDFLLAVAREWMAYVNVLRGRARKCLVLDLDNVLWGGIVGEAGPLGISLGHEYPGNAFREFQRTLLEFYGRGIILAINSRNNEADVDEVFEKNPHMLLKKEHFAARRINWEPKTDNLRALAQELNIGADSMVFIDDDPVNRAAVAAELPEVYVPDWSLRPEGYVHALLDLDVFHALAVTEEDRARGAMYAAEARRRAAAPKAASPEGFLASLGIAIGMSVNADALIARVAQLTQKTNQYNLTTRRASEEEIRKWIAAGTLAYAGDVRDRFGSYGITVVAICKPQSGTVVELQTYLMSCRVAGRHVEDTFFGAVVQDLRKRGYQSLRASYIPTAKNTPIKDFLPSVGAREVERKKSGEILYEIPLAAPSSRSKKKLPVKVSMVA